MIRIIGLGSPFNDDSIGWRCLQALQQQLQQPTMDLDIVYCATPGTQLIHLLQADMTTILVDAMLTEAEVAQVYPLAASELQQSNVLSSHQISVASILQLADNLKCLPHQLHILGIAIDPRQQLTEQQFRQIQQQLVQHVSAIANRPDGA